MFRLPQQVLRAQPTPLIVAAVAAGIGAAGFYSIRSETVGQPQKTFGRGPALTSLRLHSVEKLSHDTNRFRFELPTDTSVSGLDLTSAVLTLSRPKDQLWPVIRPYTPVSDLDAPGFIDLAVKKYPNGKASNYIHSLVPGDSLFFLAALRAYSWKLNESPHVILIAGGAGITPIYQLLKGIFKNPEERTKVTLLFGINTEEDALFKEEFARYEEQFPGRFKAVYTVTNPEEGSSYRTGRVSKALIEQVMSTSQKKEKIFVCGPPAMEASLLGAGRGPFGGGAQGGILGELGYTKDQIYKF